MSGARGARPGRLRRLALVVVPLAILVLVSELVLWALGLGGAASMEGLGRGFDPRARYLVPVAGTPGAWRTQLFGDQLVEDFVIPPRGEVRRVLLLGGSNTQVFPETILEERLDGITRRGASDPGWEVINLGRSGYGSERVAILLAQAVEALAPEVVVIYSGHNEFVERGFAEELSAAWEHEGLVALAEAFGRLRLFRVVAEAVRRPEIGRSSAPEAVQKDDPAARRIPWETTELYYRGYRRNLGRMLAAARDGEARVVLCTVVSNMWSPPYVSTPSRQLTPEQAETVERLRSRAVAAVPSRFRAELRPPRRLRMHSWRQGAGTGGVAAEQVPVLRPLDGPLAEAPATGGDPIKSRSVAGAHWDHPSSWGPDVLPVLRTQAAVLARDLAPAERAALERARDLLTEALSVAPDHPAALFDLGLVTWLLGEDDAGAAALLSAAAAADRSPHSGNDVSNGIVREVAAAHPDVVLLDADRLFRERCPSGIVGYEVMMDACHLQPGARVVLMEDVAAAVMEAAGAGGGR